MALTQEYVRYLFDYRDGQLIWKRKHCSKVIIGNIAGYQAKKEHTGYRYIRVDGVLYKAHRLIFLWHHGWLPEQIDHINRERFDNRIENLRAATNSTNQMNRGARGTFMHSQMKRRWVAQIQVNGKGKHLGLFDTEEEAHMAYLKAKREFHPW